MSVLVLGLNHKTAPVSLLERLAVPAELLPKALTSLTQREHVREAVVLSTCNRVEVYAHVTRYHGGVADLRGFFAEWSGHAPEDFTDLAYDYYDDRAASHLFAVAAGLDSMVIGERQIQLQVKQAFAEADAEGACGRILQALFRRALRAGKRARAETGLSAGASSMVDVGLDAARGVLGDLRGRTVLVLGAGKMGGMAATRLRDVAGRLLVVNRTADKGERLALRVGAETLPIDGIAEGVATADLVLCSTGSSVPLVDRDTVAAAMRSRATRPLVIVDLAVPRDVDGGCAEVPGVSLLDVDAIRDVAQRGPTGAEVAKARAIVADEAARFASWRRTVRADPTIAALRAKADAVRDAELARLAPRLAELDDRQRQTVEILARGIVNTLLHEPTMRLKSLVDVQDGDVYDAVIRELFDLRPHTD